MYNADPEVLESLMDSNCDFYNFSIGLFVDNDSEVIGLVIFSTRNRSIPDYAFQPLIINKASVPGDRVLVDPRIHLHRFSSSGGWPHLSDV